MLWGWGTPFSAPPPVPEGVACGSEALTVLELAETRNQFLDELMEVRWVGGAQALSPRSGGVPAGPPPAALSPQLELFLAQHLAEMEEEADVLAASQFQLAPPALQGQSSPRVASLLAGTRALLGQLGTRRMQHLFTILASPRSPHGGKLGEGSRGLGLGVAGG